MPSLDIAIPPMGESISSGVLSKWHVQNGELIKKDQTVYELETDKITSDGIAEAAGRITILVPEGSEVQIGQTVARIDTDATAATTDQPQTPPPPQQRPITPEPLSNRVTSPTSATADNGRQTRTKMSQLRARIAERLVSAQREAAMLTTFNEADMSAVMALRAKYQELFLKRHGIKLGFMSFFVKAVVHALKEVPSVNAMIDGDFLVQNHYFDIGVAVSTDKGLLVPVIHDCDKLTITEIEKAIGEAASKAREGRTALTDLEGGVFTITNGGIFGSLLSTPIINPPQCAILGMHAIQERPVVRDGQIVARPMMYLALSYDHRIVDGRDAVTFLVNVKQAIEEPARLLLSI